MKRIRLSVIKRPKRVSGGQPVQPKLLLPEKSAEHDSLQKYLNIADVALEGSVRTEQEKSAA
jgi:hypothetical protein